MAESRLLPNCVSVAQAAVLLNVSERTVHRMIRRGQLAASKVGGRVMIRVAHLDAMLDANPA